MAQIAPEQADAATGTGPEGTLASGGDSETPVSAASASASAGAESAEPALAHEHGAVDDSGIPSFRAGDAMDATGLVAALMLGELLTPPGPLTIEDLTGSGRPAPTPPPGAPAEPATPPGIETSNLPYGASTELLDTASRVIRTALDDLDPPAALL